MSSSGAADKASTYSIEQRVQAAEAPAVPKLSSNTRLDAVLRQSPCCTGSPGHDVLQKQSAALLEGCITLGAVLRIHSIVLCLYVAVVHSRKLGLCKADVPPLVGGKVACDTMAS